MVYLLFHCFYCAYNIQPNPNDFHFITDSVRTKCELYTYFITPRVINRLIDLNRLQICIRAVRYIEEL